MYKKIANGMLFKDETGCSGKIEIEGKEYQLYTQVKTSGKGEKYVSILCDNDESVSGFLYPNVKKQSNHPDATGSLEVGDDKYELSSWKKSGTIGKGKNKGKAWEGLSLAVTLKVDDVQEKVEQVKEAFKEDDDDVLPW